MLQKSLLKFHLGGMVQMKPRIPCLAPTRCRNSVFLPESKYTVFVISSRDSCATFHTAMGDKAHRPDQIWFSYRLAQEEFALTHRTIASVTESSLL